VPTFQVASLNRQFDTLAKTDIASADCYRISLATLLGDEKVVLERIRNLEQNKYFEVARSQRFRYAGNRLQASTAFEMAKEALERPIQRPLAEVLETLSGVAAFRPGVALLQAAEKDQRVTQTSGAIPLTKEGARVLDVLGIDDKTVIAVIDEIGKLLWERRFMWMHMRPDIWVSPEDAVEPGLLIQYRLPLEPDAAADLGWDLSFRLAEKDLVRPGFALGFLGMLPSNVAKV